MTIDCATLVELVTDYLEGALDPGARAAFDGHLRDCDECGAHVEQMQVTLRIVGSIPLDTLDDAAREHLLHAFRDWTARRTG